MGQLILFIVITILFIVFMVKLFTAKDNNTVKDSNTVINNKNANSLKVNGVTINLTDEEIEKQKQLERDNFQRKKEDLKNRIKKDRDETEDFIRKRVLDGILSRGAYTEADFNRMKFMYNDGKLRSNEEVSNYDRHQSYATERKNYASECRRNNAIGFWIPFLIVFIIFCFIFNDIIFLPVSLLF